MTAVPLISYKGINLIKIQVSRSHLSQTKATVLLPRQRTVVAFLVLLHGLALVIVFSLIHGSASLAGNELWAAALGQGNAVHQTILWELRLPRVIVALMVGSSLGLAEGLLQGMLRNGLASPFLLGISAGAGLVVVSAWRHCDVYITFQRNDKTSISSALEECLID